MALLVQLKLLQTIGRFRRAEEIPNRIVEHIARELGVQGDSGASAPDRTLYRHRPAVLAYMGITSWGAPARALAEATMFRVARTRTDPADLINAAVDALVRHRFELPALDTLRRLAATAHSTVNAAQWGEVYGQLNEKHASASAPQAARHLKGTVSADQLSFVDRRHVTSRICAPLRPI